MVGLRTLVLYLLIMQACTAQVEQSCIELEVRGYDSLSNYEMQFNKRRSTLEASLRLLNDAIKCDSTMESAKFNRVRVYILLGEFRKAIRDIDDLVYLGQDSLLLFTKPELYERLNLEDSAKIIYGELGQYFGKRILKEPKNKLLIHHWLQCRCKDQGFEVVKKDLEEYRKLYASDEDFINALDSIK